MGQATLHQHKKFIISYGFQNIILYNVCNAINFDYSKFVYTFRNGKKNVPLFKTACLDHDLIMNTDTYYLIDIVKVHPSYAESSKKVHFAGSLFPILNFSIFCSDRSN